MIFLKTNLKKIIIGLLIFSVVTFSINKIRAQSDNINNQKLDTKKDKIVFPQKKDMKDEITLTGSIDASKKTDLKFQTSGLLVWVGVKEGDKVRKWQAIASLNKNDLKKKLQADFNDYRSALSTFDDTQDDYKTQKDNLTLTDDMKRILIRSQNTLNNSVINYELSDLAIKYATILSPIDGIVTHIDQPLSGTNITPATATFTIVDPKSIYFTSSISQDDVTKIKLGQKTEINLDSFPDQNINSKITYIAFTPVSGQTSTVYNVYFELPLDNSTFNYRLGMDGDAKIILSESNNALTLPGNAVKEENGDKYVLVKTDDNQLTKKIVKTGIETDDDTEILEGLSENDQVVIKQK
ncbi:MAG: efflux RND transporter periplasmic adaptor subunit [Candidatus Shapirobacteria bacterium]|nr:efflux RND transporter periplasmic adaptor subunit [Candidatus Shapirobacteria bacterium]